MIYLADQDFTLHQGDALETLRGLPDSSVHMCVTSPPFYGLRDYGTGEWEGGEDGCDHLKVSDPVAAIATSGLQGGKKNTGHVQEGFGVTCGKCGARRVDCQIGLEATPDEWVARLVAVFREVRRVLRDDGTLWLEVGDSYAHGQPGGGSVFDNGRTDGRTSYERDKPGGRTKSSTLAPGLKAKDLIGAPWLLAFALRADGWWLRSDIVWARPNPMPESVTDRPTKSHSYVFLLSKSARYFFDQEAVREKASENTHARYAVARETPKGAAKTAAGEGHAGWDSATNGHVTARNVRSVWNIATQPLPDEHYAAFPERLAERCILAGTSERGVCPECGAPWQRIIETGESSWEARKALGHKTSGYHVDEGPASSFANPDTREAPEGVSTGGLGWVAPRKTTGWERSCDHDWQLAITPAVVLDPFMGSGTTALVARRLGRRCLGIELSPEYCAMAGARYVKQAATAPIEVPSEVTDRLTQLSLLTAGAPVAAEAPHVAQPAPLSTGRNRCDKPGP